MPVLGSVTLRVGVPFMPGVITAAAERGVRSEWCVIISHIKWLLRCASAIAPWGEKKNANTAPTAPGYSLGTLLCSKVGCRRGWGGLNSGGRQVRLVEVQTVDGVIQRGAVQRDHTFWRRRLAPLVHGEWLQRVARVEDERGGEEHL